MTKCVSSVFVLQWKTYKMLFKTIVFFAMLPAGGLYSLITMLMFGAKQHNDTDVCGYSTQTKPKYQLFRVTLSVVCWFALCALALLASPTIHHSSALFSAQNWLHVLLVAVMVCLALNTLAITCRSHHNEADNPTTEWLGSRLRFSWLNCLALLGVATQGVLLVLICVGTFHYGTPELAKPQQDIRHWLSDYSVAWTAAGLSLFWLVTASLSWVVSDQEAFQSSVSFVAIGVIFRDLLTFPIVTVLSLQVRMAVLENGGHTIPTLLSIFILLFVTIMSQLGQEALCCCRC